MSFAFPGGTNTYIPTLELSGNLIVGFSRNTKDFAVNKYCKITPVKKKRGQYVYLNQADIARFAGGTTAQRKWAPGTLSPTGLQNTQSFEYREFLTERYREPITMDSTAVDQAEWPILSTHSELAAQAMMTNRALLASTELTTTGNYAGSHVDTATNWGGGLWDAGTVTAPYLFRGLRAASQRIQVDTVGKLNYKNLCLVMNPNTAGRIAGSAEIHDYLARSPFALAQVKGDEPGQNTMYGLPDRVYGVRLIIEDAVYNDDNKFAATVAGSYVFPDQKAVLLLSDEHQEKVEGSVDFNMMHMFVYEDMKVESWEDPKNRLTELTVTDDIQAKMVAPVTAVLVTSATS